MLENLRTHQTDFTKQFQQHIWEIENKYHKDQAGQFESLWPELKFLLEQHE